MKRKDALWVMQMCRDRDARSEAEIEAFDTAIDALKREQPDEWCDDCKEYDTEKKCCPRFNRVIRGAMKREPSEDGTLEVKVEDATKVGRVLISDDKHRGGLYYPDEDEPQGISFENDTKIKSCSKDSDLISRADAIEALGEEPLVWCDDDYEIAERSQWRDGVEAIKSVPSADRPRGEWIETAQDYYETVNKKGGGVNENTEFFADDIACPNCLAKFSNIDNETERFDFCPNCGADMRGDTE